MIVQVAGYLAGRRGGYLGPLKLYLTFSALYIRQRRIVVKCLDERKSSFNNRGIAKRERG